MFVSQHTLKNLECFLPTYESSACMLSLVSPARCLPQVSNLLIDFSITLYVAELQVQVEGLGLDGQGH